MSKYLDRKTDLNIIGKPVSRKRFRSEKGKSIKTRERPVRDTEEEALQSDEPMLKETSVLLSLGRP